jgi:hypothetical protein
LEERDDGAATATAPNPDDPSSKKLVADEKAKAGYVPYWRHGLAGNSRDLAISDPSRFRALTTRSNIKGVMASS